MCRGEPRDASRNSIFGNVVADLLEETNRVLDSLVKLFDVQGRTIIAVLNLVGVNAVCRKLCLLGKNMLKHV